MPRLRLRRARAPVKCLDPHAPHQRFDVTPAGLAPIGSQKTAQHPRPRKRELQMQPVDLAHEFEIGRRHRARQVIHRAARKAGGLGLFRDAQRMITVDHRFALSNPALVSAPSKKSFSSVNSPIFACKLFKSTPEAVASLFPGRTPRPRRRGAGLSTG